MLGAQVLMSFVINAKYGIDSVGIYALVLAIAQISITGLSQPFSSLIRRDLAVLGEKSANQYVKDVNFFRLINILFILLLVFLSTPFLFKNVENILPFLFLIIIAKGFEMLNDTYFVTYQSLSQYKKYAILKITYASAILLSLMFFYFLDLNIYLLYITQVVIGILLYVINLFLIRYKLSIFKFKKAPRVILIKSRKKLLHEVWPMMLNSLISQSSAKLNAIIIFNLISAKDLGIFSILIMFSTIFSGVGNSIGIISLGKFSIIFEESIEKFKHFFKKSLFIFFAIGLLLAGIYVACTPLLQYFYKLNIDNIFALNIIIGIAIPFLFVTSSISNIFLILKKQIAGVYVSIIVLCINITLYIILSNRYELYGAAYAYSTMAILQLLLIIFWSYKILQKRQVAENI